MKAFSKLTDEEQLAIIAYQADNTYYYSKITALTEDSMFYEDNSYSLTPAQYDIISKGMSTYEIYKLQMTASDASRILRETAKETIEQLYTEKLDKVISTFNDVIAVIIPTIDTASHTVTKSTTHIAEVLASLNTTRNKLVNNVDLLDLATINAKLEMRLSDVADVKNKFTKELEPVQKDLTSLIKSLRTIVLPSE